MESLTSARRRLERCETPRGDEARDFTVGWTTFRFLGLDDALAAELRRRWGGFLIAAGAPGAVDVNVVRGDGAGWLPPAAPGEAYRLEGERDRGGVLARSHHFALGSFEGGWRLALEETAAEPLPRMMDNAARYLVAREAIEAGGMAFHGAGVERDGRAWIFAGPSRAGKSTAVSLSTPALSLGDDFAVVFPEEGRFVAHAVPFDNAEVPPPGADATDPLPLEAILRLHQAAAPRLVCPSRLAAQASLLACAAFPWAVPDLLDRLQANAEAILEAGLFAHLEFAKDPSFWALLDPPV